MRRGMVVQPRRRGRGCLVWLVVLVWLVLGAALLYQYYLGPRLREAVSREVQRQVSVPTPAPGTSQPVPVVPPIDMAGIVEALPAGEFRVSEAQINDFIATRAASLRPIDRAAVRLVPGEVQVELGAYGLSSTARAGLAVQEGRVIVVNPRLDGPLSAVIQVTDIVGPIEQALNTQLSTQGRRINEVRVEQGQIYVRVDR